MIVSMMVLPILVVPMKVPVAGEVLLKEVVLADELPIDAVRNYCTSLHEGIQCITRGAMSIQMFEGGFRKKRVSDI